jgi:hypothetical protein
MTDVSLSRETISARTQLALAGALLVAGGACTVAALSLPPLWSIVTSGISREVRLIGEHRGAWQLGLWLWALSAGLTMPGMLALASALRGSVSAVTGRRLPLADATLAAAAGMFVAGSVLWLANVAFGASVAVSVADTVRGGGAIPDWFAPVQQWASALWQAGAPMLALSLILYGLVVRAGVTLPSWAGWLVIAAGAIVLVSFAPLGGTPPFVIYLLATLPLGVVAVLRARPLPRFGALSIFHQRSVR